MFWARATEAKRRIRPLVELGILHDRGPSPCCPESYRACQGTDPNVLESVSFTDRENLSIRKSPPPNLKLPRIGLCHTGAPPALSEDGSTLIYTQVTGEQTWTRAELGSRLFRPSLGIAKKQRRRGAFALLRRCFKSNNWMPDSAITPNSQF